MITGSALALSLSLALSATSTSTLMPSATTTLLAATSTTPAPKKPTAAPPAALPLVAPTPAPAVAVDPGTVQAAFVVEYDDNAACRARIVDGRVCGVGRKVELLRLDKSRALALTNEIGQAAPKACATPSHYAFVYETTRGVYVVEANFACHTLAGRTMTRAQSAEVAGFLRLQGMVNGL